MHKGFRSSKCLKNSYFCGSWAKEIVARKDTKALQDLAKRQIDVGACMVDVNVGSRVKTEMEDMR